MGFVHMTQRPKLMDDVLAIVTENPDIDVKKISKRLGLSEDGVAWFLRDLCHRGDLEYAEVDDGSGGRKLGLFHKVKVVTVAVEP